LNLNESTTVLRLSKEALEALEALGICTIQELLDLDIRRVSSLSNCREATYRAVYSAKLELTKRFIKKRRFTLSDTIDTLNLPYRDHKALSNLKVGTIEELLLLDANRVWKVAGYHMVLCIRAIQKQVENSLPEDQRYKLKGIVSTVNRFANTRSEEGRKHFYHKASVDDSIGCLDLDIKTRRALNILGIKTVKGLLTLDASCVSRLRGYGRATENRIIRIQRRLRPSFPSDVVLDRLNAQHKRSRSIAFDPLVFPVPLSIMDFLDESKPSADSVLNQTLAKLYAIAEQEQDLLWSSFESELWGELNLDEKLWDKICLHSIFREDPLETLLSMTIGVIIPVFDSGPAFAELLREFARLAQKICRRPLAVSDYDVLEDTPILAGLSVNDFLHVFDIPKHLVKPFQRAGYEIWTGVAELSERDVVSDLGFGFDSLYLIRLLWNMRPYLKGAGKVAAVARAASKPFETLENMIADITLSWPRKRWQKTNTGKMALPYFLQIRALSRDETASTSKDIDIDANSKSRRITLEELAKKHNVTREAVRQAAKRLEDRFSCAVRSKEFSLFWLNTYNIICMCGGIIDIKDFLFLLRALFRWQKLPQINHISKFIELNPLLEMDMITETLRLKHSVCVQCKNLEDKLVQLAGQLTDRVTTREMYPRVLAICTKNCDCDSKTFESISPCLIKYVLSKHHNLVRVKGDSVYPPQSWAIEHGSLVEATELVLRQSGRPMCLTEICGKLLETGRRDSFLDGTIHRALTRSENVLPWDRGTFIHKDYIQKDRGG